MDCEDADMLFQISMAFNEKQEGEIRKRETEMRSKRR